ncbi:phospholipase A2 [Deinococcus sp. YIM 134068]|uniref:phospholipase A2 n=1 Tax=Deinococcus lichenicola TaxID=3118910 RepID=UPI002F9396AA
MKTLPFVTAALALTLAACGQTSTPGASVADYASRPELADADSQAILARYGNDPGLLAALQEAYGERPASFTRPEAPAISGLDLASDRLAYVKRTGWGTVGNYNAQYAAYAGTSSPYPGLDWTRDGCSAPDGLGLGYREDFRPSCHVHDFAYRNLKVYERTSANRLASDDAFYVNMKSACAAKSWYARPACYSAAYAYYQAVRVGGSGSF